MYEVNATLPPLGDQAGNRLSELLRESEYMLLPSKSMAMTALPPLWPLVTKAILEPKKPGSPV